MLALNFSQEDVGWVASQKIAKMCSVCDRTALNTCRALEEKQLVTSRGLGQNPEEVKRHILFGKTPQRSCAVIQKTCEWCGGTTAVLHSHHFPIRKEHGGVDTVDICPNCHAEYHAIEGLTEYLINLNHPWFKNLEVPHEVLPT